jgi:hypothetical protein
MTLVCRKLPDRHLRLGFARGDLHPAEVEAHAAAAGRPAPDGTRPAHLVVIERHASLHRLDLEALRPAARAYAQAGGGALVLVPQSALHHSVAQLFAALLVLETDGRLQVDVVRSLRDGLDRLGPEAHPPDLEAECDALA